MGSAAAGARNLCPHCGAMLAPGREVCWLCGGAAAARPGGAAVAAATAAARIQSGSFAEYRPAATRGRFQFGLSSLLLIMTLVAILCSIIKMAPGLGIVLAILALPALVRTCIAASQEGASGQPMPFGKKLGVFLLTMVMSYAVLAAAGIAASVAFFFTCLATLGISPRGANADDTPLLVGSIAGGIVAVVVAAALTWLFWKISRRRRTG
ncbi:MAG: hypothetical protein ACLQLG_09620 [Thermoguttaceae bacterium]